MPVAYSILPDRFADDRHGTIERGLEAAGWRVERGPGMPRGPADLLVTWTVHRGHKERAARAFEAAGGRVLVCEEAYFREVNGERHFALALSDHNGAGRWPLGGPERWESFGIALEPWRRRGRHILVREQAGLLGELGVQVPELGRAFTTLLERTSQEAGTLDDVVDVLGRGFVDAFEGAIQRGESLSDVLKGLALDMAEIALKTAGNAVLESILGGLLGGLGGGIGGGGRAATAGTSIPGGIGGFAKGAAFAPDSVMARNLKEFARGGIVDTPEAFAFAHGLGIMGEAGPEAILPLARARSGELGVRAMLGRRPEAGGSAPAAAGPTFIINAPGADRDGMREVMDFIRFVHGEVVRLDRSIEPRSLRAWANHRRRGGFR